MLRPAFLTTREVLLTLQYSGMPVDLLDDILDPQFLGVERHLLAIFCTPRKNPNDTPLTVSIYASIHQRAFLG